MTDVQLIERVAKAAGWRTHWIVKDRATWYIETTSTAGAERGELTPAGTLYLIKALLDASWTLEKEDGKTHWWRYMRRTNDRDASQYDDDFETATINAYLIAFEPKEGV